MQCNEGTDPLSRKLIALSDHKWKNLRDESSNTFTSGNLMEMISLIIECGESLQNHLENWAGKGELLDICEISKNHTTNVNSMVDFDTSSTTIAFCLYELAKNPNVQDHVLNEIDHVLNKYNGNITYESISEMKLLEACIDGEFLGNICI